MDISTILISLLQAYPKTASMVPLVGIAGYALTHIFPLLPVPVVPAKGVWPLVYGVLSVLAGNWGNAVNLTAPASAGVVGGAAAVSSPQVATSSVPATAGSASVKGGS